ncbi:serine/threonine-protein kinase MPS1 [Eurytemora carolleeae]|uniref:serine/threonine-protein kinase MPS1 n=1 Tax=Eurytemora carolleeae TaxID=1294199 RepID=UPI000C779725|nr:serine/threonine-protein kinase MPS1 [Eurytemora carolleeae]|eukprot:XP_023345125.1 serine/threonine-protein kinase MPS1-like [Eurytemora affinis]
MVKLPVKSAVGRESRIRQMQNLPMSSDKTLAARLANLGPQVKKDDMGSNTWMALRKRLISAKMKEAFSNSYLQINGVKYTIIKKVGDGGFSSVYEVYNEERNLFAVKVVNLITKDGFTDKDLMHEIHLLKSLQDCDRVINLKDWEHRLTDEEDMLYAVLERGDTDLAQILRNSS